MKLARLKRYSLEYLAPLLVAFAIVGILLFAIGVNPLQAFSAIFSGSFGDVRDITKTLLKTSPLILTGLAISVAFRCKVWNIGGEGQLYMGALATAWIGVTLIGPPELLIPLILITGFLAGAFWGVIPGWLKARLGVNEVVTTVMMNFIAILFITYLVNGPLAAPEQATYPRTAFINATAQLPKLISGTRLHIGILVALIFAVIIYVVLMKSILGYGIRAVGANPNSARYGGIDVSRYVVISMLLSGGLAGIAGAIEVAGVHYFLNPYISPGYGYLGIVVGLLGGLHPLGIIPAGLFFGGLLEGSLSMQRELNLPTSLALVIEGVVIISFLSIGLLARRKKY